jgi:endonuclease III
MPLLSPSNIATMFARFQQHEPAPKTELKAPNPFCLLVSIVLSAQATDVAVNKATKPLYAIADSPEAIIALGEEGLKTYIKTIGLFNSKAKNIITLCHQLRDEHGGIIPTNRDDLQTLAGVGRKTANVWLNCVHGTPLVAVDTHVFRVSNRVGLTDASNVLQCEMQLMNRIPQEYMQHAHHWLILHGRYICKARVPNCDNCIISDICLYPQKNPTK